MRPLPVAALLACLTGCATQRIPDPEGARQAYARAASRGDADALYAMMTDEARRSIGVEGARRGVADATPELAARAESLGGPGVVARVEARSRTADGEEVVFTVEDGAPKLISAHALPARARTPAQALDQLRRALARRSYAALLRLLSKETRASMERDLSRLVTSLERPDALDVKVSGDKATVDLGGGHRVRLRREDGAWVVEDFE